MSPIIERIATNMVNLRKEKDWNQTDLSEKSGVSREMIDKYERAKAAPSIEAAKKMADAFGVSLDYFVGEGILADFDKKTLSRLQLIEKLNPTDKQHVYALLDAFLFKCETQATLDRVVG